ncbi:uncharacterized protein [Epargyreus clarus]|uniref:uncharacterized protein n=1 Tax=Epargyreus clarus TaxID=520877 RepID=UPI003C2EC51D
MASAYFMLRILKKKRNTLRKRRKEECDESVSNNKKEIKIIEAKKCRICLQEGNIPIYANEFLLECSEYIRQFGDIVISYDDEFPKYLCNTCLSLLQNAILFRKKAKESDVILRQSLNSNNSDYDDPGSSESFIDESIIENDKKCNIESSKIYTCEPCCLNFVNSTEYMLHRNSKQHKNVRIQCPICFGLLTSQLYKKHLARHQSASHLVCDVCGKLYRKDNLVRHLQLHSYDLPYQCQLCPYRGRFIESLKIHMRTHTGVKPFSCDKCQLHFLTRSNLNRHMLTHTKERPFKCTECGRGFYVKRDLDVHFKADHAGIKDFACRMCGNKYGTRKGLMRHELRVHKRDKLAKGRMPLYLQAEYKK